MTAPATVDSRSRFHDQRVTTYTTDPNYTAVMPYEDVQLVPAVQARLADVLSGKVPMEHFVAQLSAEQMSRINCGTGWGVADEKNPVVGGSSSPSPAPPARPPATTRIPSAFPPWSWLTAPAASAWLRPSPPPM